MNSSSLAGHVVELLDKIVKSNSPADRIISDFYRERRYLGSHDRKWINERVYAIMRNLLLLKSISGSCDPGSGLLGIFLAYEIGLAKKSTQDTSKDYSQLIETYRLAGHRVDLDQFSSCLVDRLAVIEKSRTLLWYSFPEFFEGLLAVDVRPEIPELLAALNHEGQMCLRVNASRCTREDVVRHFAGRGLEVTETKYSPAGIYVHKRLNLNTDRFYLDGMFEVQEEASQLLGLVVNPGAGETVVDACAGAGGKSLQIADLSGRTARIITLDIDSKRLSSLTSRARRAGFDNIETREAGLWNYKGIEDLIGAADKVVIDAPCTGSGTIRRNPDKKFKLNEDDVYKMASYQERLIKHYSSLVKTGGELFYATCSIFKNENSDIIARFLESTRNFRKLDVGELLPARLAGVVEDGFVSTYPHRHGMDGFFIAALKREE